jgi:plasmid replication initiation protein
MDDKGKETRQEVFKHSAAIHIENNITFVQRRAFNALLFHAYNELETAEEHRIPIQRLADLIGYDSHDMDYLKEASKAMMRCIVEWNVLEKDAVGPKWGATALLAQATIDKGIFTYAYSPELRRRLHNPAMYARLDLNLQRRFNSKYGLALWELCADYLGSGREYGETPYIPLESFRKLMGIADGAYPTFKRLKDKVLNPAVDEINEVSDFRVVVDEQRQGRKVTALKFKIRRVALLSEAKPEQKKLFPELEDIPLVVKELKDAGISTQDALEIWQQGFGYVNEKARPEHLGEDPEATFAEYIREKIHLLKRRLANSRVENTTGFLLKAIKENYANPEFAEAQKRQVMEKQKKTRQQRQLEMKALTHRQETLSNARDEAIRQRCKALVEESPELIAPVVETLRAEDAAFQKFYNKQMTAADNYRHTTGLWSFIDAALERHYPERFADIYAAHDPGLAELKERLAALEQA